MRVLLVEDQRDFAEKLAARLAGFGCAVTWVTSAQECFEAATGEPPHIILVSSKLGPMSGLNICNGLKRDPKLRKIPLAIMSGEGFAQLATHMALTTRADAYVNKELEEVVDHVRDVMEARWDKGALIGRTPPPSTQRALIQPATPDDLLSTPIAHSLSAEPAERNFLDLVLTTPREHAEDALELITQESIQVPSSVPEPAAPDPGDEAARRIAELEAQLKQQAQKIEALERERNEQREQLESLNAKLTDDT